MFDHPSKGAYKSIEFAIFAVASANLRVEAAWGFRALPNAEDGDPSFFICTSHISAAGLLQPP